MSAHYEEELELFALGDLEPAERAQIEEHLTGCADCTRRLGEAEETLAKMTSLLPAYRAPRQRPAMWRPSARLAVVAAFASGLLVAALTLAFVNVNSASRDDVRAQVAMTQTHFAHVQLSATESGAPAAKVIFAPDRSWMYAIADTGRSGYRLLLLSAAGPPHDLGGLVSHGETATLFVPHPPEGNEVALALDGHIVARGKLP